MVYLKIDESAERLDEILKLLDVYNFSYKLTQHRYIQPEITKQRMEQRRITILNGIGKGNKSIEQVFRYIKYHKYNRSRKTFARDLKLLENEGIIRVDILQNINGVGRTSNIVLL